MTIIRFYFSTQWAGCKKKEDVTIEHLGYTQEEWNSLSNEEKAAELNEMAADWASNLYEFGAMEV